MTEPILSENDIVTSRALDYKQKALRHGNLQYVQVFSNQFGTPITLNSGQSPVVFNLPTEVMNFGQSHLLYTVILPAPTAGAGTYIWYPTDTISEISHIQLYGGTNQWICDLDTVGNYYKICGKSETSQAEFQSNDFRNRLYPSNSLNNTIPALRVLGGSAVAQPSLRNYVEPSYFQRGESGAEVRYQVDISLRQLKNTILAMDKNFYFNQIIYMKIFFGPLTKIAYQSTAADNPGNGAPANYVTADTLGPRIENLQLMLAVETNPDERSHVMSKVMNGGMSLIIPYVQNFKNPNTGSSENVNVQLDIGFGRTLLKMYHSVFCNVEQLSTMYDCSNLPIDGTLLSLNQKVNTYYTSLNNRRNQMITLDCTRNGFHTDYMQQKNGLKGSVVEDRDMFQYNWFHLDDWSSFSTNYIQDGEDYLMSGVAMGPTPITWTFNGLTMNGTPLVGTGYNHYTYGIFTKRLTITPTGPMVD